MSEPHAAPDADPVEPLALSVLALDDDPDFREFIRAALRADGHDVRTAADAREFFDAADASLPDVALLDMKMGPDSGEDVLAEIRRRWPKLCVIVLTGYPSLDSMRQTFKLDVFDYLAKPFSVDDLRRSLAQAAESKGLGQSPQDRLRVSLGRQIRVARTERGWTLRELSEASAISVSQLSSIERGAHLPSMESLLAIAHALDHKPSQWLEASGF